MQAKYLYLTRPEWAETWISGGSVPIALASKYRSIEREGTLTPDENLIHDSPVDIASLRQMGFHFENVRGLTFNGNTFNGRPLPDFKNASYYSEDGLILSFSNALSTKVRDGQFRLFFFSREEPRIHVHVAHPDGEAKFWLTPVVKVATYTGLSARQLREAHAVVETHIKEIQNAWNDHFGS